MTNLMTCTKCRIRKPLEYFDRHAKGPNGRRWDCKSCRREYVRKMMEERGDEVRARKRDIYAYQKHLRQPTVADYLAEKGKEKVCNTCNTSKPLPAFNRYVLSSDGRMHKCRECHKQYMKEYRAKKKASRTSDRGHTSPLYG